MSLPEEIRPVPTLNDTRIRVFRRDFAEMEEYGTMTVDCYAIVSERYLLICDTLLHHTDMREVMARLQDGQVGRQLVVFNSHSHWDHTWGNSYFGEQVPILAHELCRRAMQSAEMRTLLNDYQQRIPLFGDVRLSFPTLTFQGRMAVHGGDLEIILLHAPGHSADHCALWLPQLRLLLAFDALESPLPLIEDADSIPALFATMQLFESLQAEHVLCSHSTSVGGALIAENLQYLQTLEQRCRSFLQRTQPTRKQISEVIGQVDYRFEEVIAGSTLDRKDYPFYSEAHQQNIEHMLRWLISA